MPDPVPGQVPIPPEWEEGKLPVKPALPVESWPPVCRPGLQSVPARCTASTGTQPPPRNCTERPPSQATTNLPGFGSGMRTAPDPLFLERLKLSATVPHDNEVILTVTESQPGSIFPEVSHGSPAGKPVLIRSPRKRTRHSRPHWPRHALQAETTRLHYTPAPAPSGPDGDRPGAGFLAGDRNPSGSGPCNDHDRKPRPARLRIPAQSAHLAPICCTPAAFTPTRSSESLLWPRAAIPRPEGRGLFLP